jgi:hypothetical protein
LNKLLILYILELHYTIVLRNRAKHNITE